jgi:hypothetical protein
MPGPEKIETKQKERERVEKRIKGENRRSETKEERKEWRKERRQRDANVVVEVPATAGLRLRVKPDLHGVVFSSLCTVARPHCS